MDRLQFKLDIDEALAASPHTNKAVANSWFMCNKMPYRKKLFPKIKMDRLKFKLDIDEALAASPHTNKGILTDDEDNSAMIPLAK
ncbi:hypothetical protein TNCV_4402711 [Trichonephila clavipes]|uniref:Uncharacterized protein n=1 Tax=Trichonephila clavipes TaxID=2585209 RepID=A0A8X6VFL5_TRICX|nr:hypothetical protein TNCV_4402711 [Trichonephila clavipes]